MNLAVGAELRRKKHAIKKRFDFRMWSVGCTLEIRTEEQTCRIAMLCTFSNVMLSVSCVSCTSTKRKARRKGRRRRRKDGG